MMSPVAERVIAGAAVGAGEDVGDGRGTGVPIGPARHSGPAGSSGAAIAATPTSPTTSSRAAAAPIVTAGLRTSRDFGGFYLSSAAGYGFHDFSASRAVGAETYTANFTGHLTLRESLEKIVTHLAGEVSKRNLATPAPTLNIT